MLCLKLKQTSCSNVITEKRHTHCTHYETRFNSVSSVQTKRVTKLLSCSKKATLTIRESGNIEIFQFIQLIGHRYKKNARMKYSCLQIRPSSHCGVPARRFLWNIYPRCLDQNVQDLDVGQLELFLDV